MTSPIAFSKHPSNAVLLDNVTGTLSFAHHLVVETHLLSCVECQDSILFLEKVGQGLLDDLQPVQPPPGLLNRCLSSISREKAPRTGHIAAENGSDPRNMIGETVLPSSLQDLKPNKLRWLAPGIWHSTLWRDHSSTLHFIRVRGGVMLPAHRHHGLELTCVLSGAFQASGKLYNVGDVSEEDDNDEDDSGGEQDHLVVAELAEDCMCIMATTGRLRFRGWMARLLQPVMPF